MLWLVGVSLLIADEVLQNVVFIANELGRGGGVKGIVSGYKR